MTFVVKTSSVPIHRSLVWNCGQEATNMSQTQRWTSPAHFSIKYNYKIRININMTYLDMWFLYLNWNSKTSRWQEEHIVCGQINYELKPLWNYQKLCDYIIMISNYHFTKIVNYHPVSWSYLCHVSSVKSWAPLINLHTKYKTCVKRRSTSTWIFKNVDIWKRLI